MLDSYMCISTRFFHSVHFTLFTIRIAMTPILFQCFFLFGYPFQVIRTHNTSRNIIHMFICLCFVNKCYFFYIVWLWKQLLPCGGQILFIHCLCNIINNFFEQKKDHYEIERLSVNSVPKQKPTIMPNAIGCTGNQKWQKKTIRLYFFHLFFLLFLNFFFFAIFESARAD